MDAEKWQQFRDDAIEQVAAQFDTWEAVAESMDPITATFRASIQIEGEGVYTGTANVPAAELFADDVQRVNA